MTLGENLQYIRGKFGLTQEQLAERLDVSRQSVSKWESTTSFPETDKILQICDMFNVSVDDLMRGDVRRGFAVDNADYDRHMNSFSYAIAAGVGIILIGISIMLFLNAAGFFETISTIIFFLFIIAAVSIFIISGIRHGDFCKKHPYIENFYTQSQIDAYSRRFPLFIAVPVALIMLGVILMIASEELAVLYGWNEDFFAAAFLLILAVSVPVIIYGGMQKSKYDLNEYNRDNFAKVNSNSADIPEDVREKYEKANKKKSLAGRISGAIMLLATAVFLLLGLGWQMWHICWIAFPVGGILCGIVYTLAGDED